MIDFRQLPKYPVGYRMMQADFVGRAFQLSVEDGLDSIDFAKKSDDIRMGSYGFNGYKT